MIWRRLPKKAKVEHEQLLRNLEARIRDGPWSENAKNKWMGHGSEVAQIFQRLSSCVEGRNGVLSLNHHRFHRLNPKGLRVLTIIHNFDVRRSDGTTAVERLFGTKHENLFDYLVANVAYRVDRENSTMNQRSDSLVGKSVGRTSVLPRKFDRR